ncbi:MAG: ABC-ATPase domain-containing protein [Desulfurococcales archaeon]|nr:ABC-ATPase domain-containing protein [Desulfurococcales archaeon]
MKRITADDLENILHGLDKSSYKQYRALEKYTWHREKVTYRFLKIQGDPFAPPSILEAKGVLPRDNLEECKGAETALADKLLRILVDESSRTRYIKMGEGNSGRVLFYKPGPVMIPRASTRVIYSRDGTRYRILIRVGLPSRRRRILADEAARLLLEKVPAIIENGTKRILRSEKETLEWCRLYRDQELIRGMLEEKGLVSFIADGSILPRRCGGCSEPLKDAVPFESPPSLRVEIETEYHGTITGMGIRRGLTVIAGPAFHGKTTLLEAIRSGVWNHIPGDGRELVVTRRDAVYVKSENGRRVSCVDLRNWLRGLPGGRSIDCFTTSDASGATSAAASIEEYVSMGSRLILVDEDEIATNLLHRDKWTEDYTGKKTLVTLTEMAGSMKENGISLVVVASGTLPLLAEADTIIVMDEYRPRDASKYREEARRLVEVAGLYSMEEYRRPRPRSYRLVRRPRKWKVTGLLYQDRERNLARLDAFSYLEDPGQLYSAVKLAYSILDSRPRRLSSRDAEERVIRVLDRSGDPDLVYVRGFEVLGAAERLPGFESRNRVSRSQ